MLLALSTRLLGADRSSEKGHFHTCCMLLQQSFKFPRNLVVLVLYGIHSVMRIVLRLANFEEAFIEDSASAFSFGNIQETLPFGLLKLGFLQNAPTSPRRENKES